MSEISVQTSFLESSLSNDDHPFGWLKVIIVGKDVQRRGWEMIRATTTEILFVPNPPPFAWKRQSHVHGNRKSDFFWSCSHWNDVYLKDLKRCLVLCLKKCLNRCLGRKIINSKIKQTKARYYVHFLINLSSSFPFSTPPPSLSLSHHSS